MRLTEHFSLAELTRSETATRLRIPNVPGPAELKNLIALCIHVLEPLRMSLARPIIVTSGYRSPRLNAAIGSKPTSQHLLGQAADIYVPGMTVKELFEFIKSSGVPYDQLIDEYGDEENGWVHVSYAERCRGQELTARHVGNDTIYQAV